ncbi:hypothetical protein D770_06250 [Flammeovirgaceae bacterium 311]|nr:hypothetical protein D770_06250 [Flammeovirgaceae bacterium 311]
MGAAVQGQHFQLTINAITSCTTLACIEEIQQKNKALKSVTPHRREIGSGAYRLLLDFSLPQRVGKGEEEKEATAGQKNFRLLLLIQENNLLFAQLEQFTEEDQLETTYLFINKVEELKGFVDQYNKRNKTNYTYQNLIKTITSPNPFLWVWL